MGDIGYYCYCYIKLEGIHRDYYSYSIQVDKVSREIFGYYIYLEKNHWLEGDIKMNYTAIIDQYFCPILEIKYYLPLDLNKPQLPQIEMIANKLYKYNILS